VLLWACVRAARERTAAPAGSTGPGSAAGGTTALPEPARGAPRPTPSAVLAPVAVRPAHLRPMFPA
jgi:hypothetical protein